MTSRIEAIFLVVGAFICSNKDSKFIHFASQNRTSVIGPGKFPGVFISSAESLLNTYDINKRMLGYMHLLHFCDLCVAQFKGYNFLIDTSSVWYAHFMMIPSMLFFSVMSHSSPFDSRTLLSSSAIRAAPCWKLKVNKIEYKYKNKK